MNRLLKTQHGCVLEFQHSFISNEERSSRNNFYPNLVWVVDGLRRKRDKDQFFNAIKSGVKLIASPLLIKISTDESKLVQEWGSGNTSVFFDFGEEQRLWWLLPFKHNGFSYIVPFSRQEFLKFNLGKMTISFDTFLKKCISDFASFFQQKEKVQRVVPIPNRLNMNRYRSRRRSIRL